MDRRRLLVRGGRALAGAVAGLGMSCGDFLNDYEGIGGRPEYRAEVTAMFWPELAPGGELRRLEMTPMRIRRFSLEHAPEEDARWLADTLDRESRKLGNRVERVESGRLVLRGS